MINAPTNDNLEELALSYFKLHRLKPHQHAIIQDVLKQQDILAVLPTGSGKSLCYQLPALLLNGVFIVVSPLIALMIEQVEKLKALNISAECLHSNLNIEHQNSIIEKIPHLKLLYVSPERLLTPAFFKIMRNNTISGFAIDEVHCMLQWGADFRPEYVALKHLKHYFPNVPIIALTATATQKQQKAIIQHLKINPRQHIYSAYKSNIQYQVIPTSELKSKTLEICQTHINQSGIIYCATRRRVEFIYNYLQSQGIPALRYHAGMTAEDRDKNHQIFYQSKDHVMVATVAFGMGVDKQDIRYIVHFDLPGRLDQLIQETGRAARDGDSACSYLLYHPEHFLQLNLWRFKNASPLLYQEMIQDLQKMSIFLNSQQCFRTLIVEHFESEVLPSCGECIRCLNPPGEPKFVHDDIFKLLSTLYRIDESANWETAIDILLGLKNARTSAYFEYSTFGIGQNLNKYGWYLCINYLFALGWITFSESASPGWRLTLTGKKVLKSKTISLGL